LAASSAERTTGLVSAARRLDGLRHRGGADAAERVGREVAHVVVAVGKRRQQRRLGLGRRNDAQSQRGLLAQARAMIFHGGNERRYRTLLLQRPQPCASQHFVLLGSAAVRQPLLQHRNVEGAQRALDRRNNTHVHNRELLDEGLDGLVVLRREPRRPRYARRARLRDRSTWPLESEDGLAPPQAPCRSFELTPRPVKKMIRKGRISKTLGLVCHVPSDSQLFPAMSTQF
jgi:hypothetical protein